MPPLQWKCGVLTTGSQEKSPCPVSRRVCVCVGGRAGHTRYKAAGRRDRRRPPWHISGGGSGDFEFHLQSFAMRGRKAEGSSEASKCVWSFGKCPCHQLLFYLGHRHSPTNLEQLFIYGNVACLLYF